MFVLSLVFLLSAGSLAWSASYSFTAKPADLYDLDHTRYYTWGINWTVPSYEKITSASLFFDDIRNWDNKPNELYVHLLDDTTSGVSIGYDNEAGGDQFAGQGILLNTWYNLTTTPLDITYNFDPAQVASLISFLSNGNFGLGFDPDCHYYNNGIKLTVNTTSVPEPGTILLLGLSLIGLAGLKRKFRK